MLERAAALKHDLGKYVAWQSANYDDDAWHGPLGDALWDALCSDLLATRSRAEADQAAWEVWEGLTEDMPRPLPEPELVEVEEAVAVLRSFEAPLRAGDRDAIAAARPAIFAAQQAIRGALRTLHRRLVREG